VIQVAALTVQVPGFTLDRVSFSVQSGTVGVITGPTGAGKTTLLEAITGVRSIAGGRVTLGDTDVTQLPPERRNTGLVYQHAWLFPHLSVQQNVAYGARAGGTVAALQELLHLEPLLHKPVSTLSGGERQLVALARALAREPATLLLDEPFAAMDSELREIVRTAVLRWAAERRITSLLVTHDAREASHVGGKRFFLDRGVLTVE
jgi:ABC-type sugar transport system ATPase subunit